jgi:Flp pilus assembly protein TadG
MKKTHPERAQAVVEFAIVLPILMMLLVGILEVGRMIFIYSAVTNASREAARYASATGLADDGVHKKFQYCDGIKERALRSAYFVPLAITISYDHGPGTGSFDTCSGSADVGVFVNTGTTQDRVVVSVTATYEPMITLIPIEPRTIHSSTARTILGIVELEP